MTDKVLSYNGFCGSLEFSMEDNCLHGKVLFINDLITYEADTPQNLQKAFEEMVDYYLDKCRREGLEPNKPFNGTFNVRIGAELHKQAAVAAAQAGQSLNDFVKASIEFQLAGKHTHVSVTNHTHHYHQRSSKTAVVRYSEETTSSWQLDTEQLVKSLH